MATLSRTASVPPAAAERHGARSPLMAVPKHLRCAVVSWHPLRAECLRVVAEREYWHAVISRNAKELRQCVFRDEPPLAIVDLPHIRSDAYGSFQELTEWLSQVAPWNGDNGILLVVCADDESVREEIWARQLGIWSYLPRIQLPLREENALDGKPRQSGDVHGGARNGLTILFREARKVLTKSEHGFADIATERGLREEDEY